jgi:hypothetical protein
MGRLADTSRERRCESSQRTSQAAGKGPPLLKRGYKEVKLKEILFAYSNRSYKEGLL